MNYEQTSDFWNHSRNQGRNGWRKPLELNGGFFKKNMILQLTVYVKYKLYVFYLPITDPIIISGISSQISGFYRLVQDSLICI